MKLDLSGIAKGYITDQVKKVLVKDGVTSAIIDLGGICEKEDTLYQRYRKLTKLVGNS